MQVRHGKRKNLSAAYLCGNCRFFGGKCSDRAELCSQDRCSGEQDGKGFKNNEITSVKNGNFLSEAETDFIFAVIGEEFGFKGSIVVIILLMLMAMECVSIAGKAKDPAGTIIAASMGGLIAFQSFVNIGVATFILPNTGLPLPFVSYGLTSLMSLYIGMGVVLNVRLQAKRS